MAVKFLDGITVNSGSSSVATIIAEGTRPVTITGGAIGSITIGGSNGGWATGYLFKGYSGTNRGGFGALGSVDTVSYFYIGDAFNDTTMIVQPNAGSVGIGTTSPSDGDLTIGTPKLHVATASSGSGTFNLAARFQSTTTDADNTGTSILINSLNDRGLLIKAGRKDGDREVAYFDVVNSGGNTTNMLTMGKFNSAYNVGIGTTAPTQKLDVNGNMVFSQRLVANANQYYVKLGVWSSASTYGIGMTNGFTYGALNNDYAMTFCMNNSSNRGWWWGYDGQSKSTGAMSCNMQGKLKINHSIGLGTVNPSATQGRIDASNDIVAYSTSDIRLKDNIKSIDKALDKVNKIQGIEFDWIEKEEIHGNSGHDVGVIAQEIEKVLPEVVDTRDNGYKAVKYEKLVPLLIEAIKDLSRQVDGLKRLI